MRPLDAPRIFAGLRRVIVDEIHALAESKRGDQLMLCLARLRSLAPGVQATGLSATGEDPAALARFMGATIELPVTVTAGRATATGIDTTQLERRAFADGPATLFIRPADLTPVADPAGANALRQLRPVTGTEKVRRVA